MRAAMALGVAGLLATAALAWAAAPPVRGPLRLTVQQQKHVDGLWKRGDAAIARGDFEEAVKLLGQIADYRAKHQGASNHEAIDAKYLVDEWRWLTKAPAFARSSIRCWISISSPAAPARTARTS